MVQQKCVRGSSYYNGQIPVGNSPGRAILGPGLQRRDLSLFKNTNINERLRSIKGRGRERLQPQNQDGVRSSFGFGSLGRVSVVRNPPIVQLGLKLYF
jgi:hypothetical protein